MAATTGESSGLRRRLGFLPNEPGFFFDGVKLAQARAACLGDNLVKAPPAMNMTRFTMDGSAALEAQLATICSRILAGIQSIISAKKLQAVVLGGGYGRGEGGVLRTSQGDQPYNDLEFYLFLHGNRLLNARKYGRALNQLSEGISPLAGLHVEFKIDSLQKLRRSGVSMFSYDLVSAHRIILGNDNLFEGCQHHLDAARIPAAEATRLLFNRCTGLLLAREILEKWMISSEDADFVGRNLAKAKLALGDALLTVFGQYHWSCLQREKRVKRLESTETPLALERIREHHTSGVAFKLHPNRISKPLDSFREEHGEISDLASDLWLWVESRRLKREFMSVQDYVFHSAAKC